MAGDWIKMRTDLPTHPKVVRMSSALKADRLRTVGGLFAVWCLFDTHSIDGQLSGYTRDALDDLISFPGFSDAMISVEWLCCDEIGLSTPRFEEHNGQSAKRRAQETERKRGVRKVSAPDADEKRTREEKRREEIEKKELKTKAPAAPEYSAITELVAVGVDKQVATDWLKIRKGKKAAPTKTGIDGVLGAIAKAGMTPDQGIRICCERSWSGFSSAWLENTQHRMAVMGKPMDLAAAQKAATEEGRRKLFGNQERTIDA